MARIAGRFLVAIGLLHVVLFPWWGRVPLLAAAQDGFFNAVNPHKDRQEIFWSLCFGMMGVFLGQLISWSDAQGKQTPAFLGWELLGLAALGAVLMPISGWWLVMVPAVLILAASRRGPVATY